MLTLDYFYIYFCPIATFELNSETHNNTRITNKRDSHSSGGHDSSTYHSSPISCCGSSSHGRSSPVYEPPHPRDEDLIDSASASATFTVGNDETQKSSNCISTKLIRLSPLSTG